jgi:hypothetical protein
MDVISESPRKHRGRLASEILKAVEADVGLENGKPSATPLSTLNHDVRDVLYRLGESKRGMPLSQTLEIQARELMMMFTADANAVIAAFIESAISLPAQSPLLAAAAAYMHKAEHSKKNSASHGVFSKSLCNALSIALVESLHRGDAQQIRLLLRFLASLGLVHIVSVKDVLVQLTHLIKAAAAARPKREARTILYAVLSCLPWLAATSPGPAEHLGLAEESDHDNDKSEKTLQTLWDCIVSLANGGLLSSKDAKLSSCIALSPEHQLPAVPDESGAHCGATQWIDADPAEASRLGVDLSVLVEDPVKVLFDIIFESLATAKVRSTSSSSSSSSSSRGDSVINSKDDLTAPGEEDSVGGDVSTSNIDQDVLSSTPLYSKWSSLAVSTIARPVDDPEVCEALGLTLRQLISRNEAANNNLNEKEQVNEEEEIDIDYQDDMTNEAKEEKRSLKRKRMDEEGNTHSTALSSSESKVLPVHLPLVLYGTDNTASTPPSSSLMPTFFILKETLADSESSNGTSLDKQSLSPLSPNAQWFIPPRLQLIGQGGLASKAGVLRALKLDGPQVTPLALWAVRELCHDTLILFHPFHSEVAAKLSFFPMGRGRGAQRPFDATPLAVEAVLSQSLWLPAPPRPAGLAYYSVIFHHLFREELAERQQQQQHAGPMMNEIGSSSSFSSSSSPSILMVPLTLQLCCRALFKYLPLLDDSVADRLSSWLAFHTSNLKFELPISWADKEFLSAISLSSSSRTFDAQHRFASSVVRRAFALVDSWKTHDGLVKILRDASPLAYEHLIPTRTTEAALSPYIISIAIDTQEVPGSSSIEASTMEAASLSTDDKPLSTTVQQSPSLSPQPSLISFASEVMTRLRSKPAIDNDAMTIWAFGSESEHKSLNSNVSLLRVFCQCLFNYGKANTRNVYVLLRRYAGLLTNGCSIEGADDNVRASAILSAATRTWAKASHVLPTVIEAIVDVGIVSPSQVVLFALVDRPSEETEACDVGSITMGFLPPLNENEMGRNDKGENEASASSAFLSSLAARLCDHRTWDIVNSTLDRARAAANAAGVAVNLSINGGVLDPTEAAPEEGEDMSRTSALIETAKTSSRHFLEAFISSLHSGLSVAHSLQRIVSNERESSEDDVACAKEVLRITLSRLRDISRRHAESFTGCMRAKAAIHDLGASISSSDRGGSPGALLLSIASGAYEVVGRSEKVPSLQRDREAIQPWLSIAKVLDL